MFDEIASVDFIWKICQYFIIGNGQPREPALCQLYQHTLIAYCVVSAARFALTKLDILDDQPVIKIGVAYLVNGRKIDYYPGLLSTLSISLCLCLSVCLSVCLCVCFMRINDDDDDEVKKIL